MQHLELYTHFFEALNIYGEIGSAERRDFRVLASPHEIASPHGLTSWPHGLVTSILKTPVNLLNSSISKKVINKFQKPRISPKL